VNYHFIWLDGTVIAIADRDITYFLNPTPMRSASQGKGKKMKPTVEQNNLSKRADIARENAFPSIDCNYQTVALPSHRGGCLQPRFSSFRNISGDYFRN